MAAVGRSGGTAEPSAAAGGTAELGSTVCMRQDKRGVRQSAAAWSAVDSCAAVGMGNAVARVAWAANTIRLAAVFADCAAIAIVAIAMAAIAEAVGCAAIAMVAAMVVSAVGPSVAAQVVPPAGLAAAAVSSAVVPVAVPVAVRLAAVAARVATVSVAVALLAVELTALSAALVPSVAVAVVVGCSIVRLAASSCPPAPSNTILPRIKRKSKMANTTERIVLLQCESIGKV